MISCRNYSCWSSMKTILKRVGYNFTSVPSFISNPTPSYFMRRWMYSGFCSCPLTNRLHKQNLIKPLLRQTCFLSYTDRESSNIHVSYNHSISIRFCSNNSAEPPKKLSLVKRFKLMYKEYWYVLVPVHIVTSTFWFSSFYYLAKSGVDIAGLLERVGAGEALVQKLRSGNSKMGYIAISYALYKIATPIRYTVTLGGTTISIKYLKDWGYIKPIPPKDKLKEIIHEKKGILSEKKANLKELYKNKSFVHRLLIKLRFRKDHHDERK